ncbi:gamma-tubulin complex component 6 [Menidia menidia]
MYSSGNKPKKSSCDSGSITGLLSDLCSCSLIGVSWKRRALGVSRESFHRVLKKRAYGALLSKLFQDGPKGPASGQSATANIPPRNKVLMMSFDLRVAGCREEAERLEDQLGRLPEGASSGLSEVDAVLELLVFLAGSAPPPPTSFSRDYMRHERPVVRRPPPWSYQCEELQRLEARAWGLVCREEWGTLESLWGTERLMDAPPGTGLLALRIQSDGDEKFGRETRLTLFGALQHTRTSDMDIRLDLPPVPSNIDVTGLAIRVPPCLDQSEDEGFQSASNLTPDSQSEPSPIPDTDMWEALRTFEPGRRRCWESVGCPPGKRESFYLTEGGREAFDQLYRLWEGEIRIVDTSTPSPVLPLPLDSQTQLVFDLLNALIGVASTTFPLNQSVQFDVRPGVCVSGASPESVSRLLGELAQYGTHYLRLSRFSLQSADKKGLVFQAFTGGLRKYLHYYRACVLSTPPALSLMTIGFLFRKVGRQLRYLSELCCVDGPLGAGQSTFPVGVKLLSYLYNEAQSNCSNENYPVLLSLLKSSCEPYTRFVSDWVYSGVFRDVYGEFMIQVNQDYLGFRDKNFWVQGYTLISKDVEDCVPSFLRHMANDVYVCGKTINLLKICCPQHYICWSELPVPRIAVTFSLQEVEEIEKECAVYRGRMERIAKHSAISREEQALRTEQARQELINQVRESAAKTLESIRGRQVSLRLAEEAKKRERFEELKQHLEQEQEWRSAAKKKQEEDDFSFARELRDREKRLQALEEQLEQRARKELIAQYSHLSEEAARRERRAMWRVQRMRLDEARAQFFMLDRQKIQAILESYPLGQDGPPVECPAVFSAQQTAPQQALEFPSQSAETVLLQDDLTMADPALISDDLDINDFLPKSPKPDSQQVDKALEEIGSDLPAACPAAPLIDYDFSAPFSPLEGITGQAPVQPRPRWAPAVQPESMQNNIPAGEHFPQVQASVPHASVSGEMLTFGYPAGQCTVQTPQQPSMTDTDTASESPQNAERGILEKEMKANKDKHNPVQPREDGVAGETLSPTPEETGKDRSHGRMEPVTANTRDHCSDSHDKADGNTSLPGVQNPVLETDPKVAELVSHRAGAQASPGVCSHSSDAHIVVGQFVSEVAASFPSRNVYGHASNSHIQIGQHVSEVDAPLPSSSVHGHASDSHIQIGQHVSEVDAPLPSSSVYGHASDSHIQIGQHVSEVDAPLPSSSVHGHASDSHIQIGQHVSEVDAPLPSSSVHGHASDSHIQIGQHVSEVDAPLPSSSVYGHASDSHIQIGQHVSEVDAPLPSSSVHGHASDSHIQIGQHVSEVDAPLPSSSVYGHASDSHIQIGQHVSEVDAPLPSSSVHGHASDSHIQIGQHVSEVDAPLPSSSVHGHSSDAHITVGENVSRFVPRVPSPNIHGHSSDAHIKVGENVSGFVPRVPSPNIHGHASDAHIKLGQFVSDVAPPLPSPSVHGHSSDAHIKVGENVSGVDFPCPAPSIHGHSSDANIKVGGFVSNVPEVRPRGSKHGHASDCVLQSGCAVSGAEPLLPPLPGSAHGHSSDSALRLGCVVSGNEPKRPALPGSAYGHSSDSNLALGCVVSKADPLPSPLPGSAFGHSSDSNLAFGCVVSKADPLLAPLPGSAYGHSSDSTLGVGCVVLGMKAPSLTLPGSTYGHSSDSSLAVGCVVRGLQPKKEDEVIKGSMSGHSSEQLVEGMGSWTSGLGVSPGEKSEEEYLMALSAQYQVEHYEDCYNLMASSPECQLLKQVTRGPWGLPMDPTHRRATDTTTVQLSEMVSLPVLIKHSVTTPLSTHVSLVNKAVVDYFFVELGVEGHFEALRHFLLMEDGEFAQSLSDLLFEKMGSGQTPGELLTPLVLNSILSKALQYSLHGDGALAANFTFALRFLPETFHPHAPDSLNCLELRYKVDWPLNIIITDSCMNKYNRLFSFLLQLKHMVWSLRDVWFHLKRTALVKGAGRSVQFRQLQLYRHEMQHFVKVIQGYIANQILQVSWSEFTAKLATASDLDAIHRTHADYLNRAIFRGLLTEKAAPVMNIIHSIFSLILKFRAQLIAQPWDSHQGEAVHPSFVAMQQSYNTFKYYSHFLFKVVTKLVNRGYQPHLEDFLLRINFNNYYKDS